MRYYDMVTMLNVMTVAELVELLKDVDRQTRICLNEAMAIFYDDNKYTEDK